MKKQLLIDMFSHFFLMYLLAKKSIIKKGLVIKNIRFKKYIQQKSSELESIKEILPTIKSIKIDEVSNEFNGEANLNGSNLSNDFDSALNSFEKNNPVNKPAIADNVTKTNTIRPQPKKSFVKKFIKKLFRKKQANELDQAEKINEIDESLKKEVSYE